MIMKIELERIFPASEDDARRKRMHFMKLLASQNDIIVNAKAAAAIDAKDAENGTADARYIAKAEQSYFYRVACSHMYEALGDFRKCWESGMIEAYRPLAEDGEGLYERLKADGRDETLLEYLKAIRDRTFHYGYDGELEDEGVAVFGEDQTAASSRYVIAEDMIMARIHEHLGLRGSDPALLELHQKVIMLRQDIQRFVDRFVATVYQRHPTAFSRQYELESGGEQN